MMNPVGIVIITLTLLAIVYFVREVLRDWNEAARDMWEGVDDDDVQPSSAND